MPDFTSLALSSILFLSSTFPFDTSLDDLLPPDASDSIEMPAGSLGKVTHRCVFEDVRAGQRIPPSLGQSGCVLIEECHQCSSTHHRHPRTDRTGRLVRQTFEVFDQPAKIAIRDSAVEKCTESADLTLILGGHYWRFLAAVSLSYQLRQRLHPLRGGRHSVNPDSDAGGCLNSMEFVER